MITQKAIGLNSRSEANPFDENGFLPLITAPMSSVVDETNYQEFHTNNIQICFPRTANLDEVHNDVVYKDSFHSMSLQEFYDTYIANTRPIGSRPHKRCIDTANGNMPQLHEVIREAKKIHGDSLIIMAGNVASVDAFIELAKTGVDYIRVGIGGGGGCNTTSNTGVGQVDLFKLIKKCYNEREYCKQEDEDWSESYPSAKEIFLKIQNGEDVNFKPACKEEVASGDYEKIGQVKIVADGISSYIKLCEQKYGFNDNGYAAINNLLYAGADLVMVGRLFAQCLESAGEKSFKTKNGEYRVNLSYGELTQKEAERIYFNEDNLYVKYSGMSTQEEQKKYKLCPICKGVGCTNDSYPCYMCQTTSYVNATGSLPPIDTRNSIEIKPSEGSAQWIPVRWTLDAWLNGSENQDSYPYLMGWVNSIKSAMAYTGSKTLKEFKQ